MRSTVLATFEVSHRQLRWPWVALSPTRRALAFVARDERIETRLWDGERLGEGPSFPLPGDLRLPRTPAPASGHGGVERGIEAFAIDGLASRAAVIGRVDGKGRPSTLVTLDARGEARRSRVDALLGGDFVGRALTFDASGQHLWLSAESTQETLVARLDAGTHAVLGVARSAPFPPPSAHELFVHPAEDAVLLLGACGQDGTFARVVRAGDSLVAVPSALDDSGEPAALVGFSADGARVYLVGDSDLRTHAWPDLTELAAIPLDDDFASSYGGVIVGEAILLDGHDADSGDGDRIMRFDASGLRGHVLQGAAIAGMWVGRLGAILIVTVQAKGEPSVGRVVAIDLDER